MSDGAAPGDEDIPLPELPDVTNSLLLASGVGGQMRDCCLDIMTRTPPERTHALVVTYTEGAASWVQAWDEHSTGPPASGGIIEVGQPNAEFEDETWRVASVHNHGDLTGIGIELSELLSWMDDNAASDDEIVMCFDSVTTLLQYADLQRAFRFLHVVTGRVRSVSGSGMYHLNPEAHDAQTRATLTGLFDAAIEREDDSWSVKQ